jgi:large subunit ribosomal protein L25
MKSVEIIGSKRAALGKKETKKLRAADLVPCVLYGGIEPIHFQVSAAEFRKVIYTPNVYLIDLNIDGTTHKALIQDVQFHPVEEQILHCDFLQITDDKPIKIEVPVKIEGYAIGMRAGGKMKLNLRRLKVKGLAKNIPDTIDINIDDLDLGQSIKVGQLNVENLEFLNSKSVPVVTIVVTRAARAAASTPAK